MPQARMTSDPSITATAHLLFQADRPRAIDTVIDYFGTGQRPVSSLPAVALPAREAV